ncbi:nickel pincer cofactor biosynthesis protein LarB [Candidatus Sumerlaeota bacterium]|nr:nickel pincer cofactor biosynthesis protein LarB [Candidatus Sumerlaeota bacterium]
MNREELTNLLTQVRDGKMEVAGALERIRSLPFADLGYAKVDLHREIRHGRPEVIFCPGKTPERVKGIMASLMKGGQSVLATRASQEIFDHCRAEWPDLTYHPDSRVITNMKLDPAAGEGSVIVVSAGTSDIPVAEEAALTARACGARVETIFDVGVSGLHRLLAHTDKIQQARALVVCAGMEGALPSVVGGLVAAPVIAVPTSVGYGASFQGLAALLGMLNSCAANVTVVNIDNGFGAGYVASLINRVGLRAV